MVPGIKDWRFPAMAPPWEATVGQILAERRRLLSLSFPVLISAVRFESDGCYSSIPVRL
jgi:hypothetical protein